MADPPPPSSAPVVARDAYGTAVEVTPEEAAARGYQIATPEEAEAYRREQQYGGALGTGTAFVTGGLRGATLGLSDVVISELGGRETLAGVREANPLASVTGEVAGGLAGLGKGGGVLGAISAPARLVTRTGHAVEGAVTGSRLLGAVTRAAVEGGAYGTGMAISESALQNKALTAEMLGSHALQGAVLGGSLAGGLGLAGKGAASLADRVRQKVTGAGVGRMMEAGGGAALVGVWDKAASRLGGAPEGAVESMFQRGKSGRLGFESAMQADDILERSADDFTDKLRGVLATKAKLEARFKGALKEDQIARIVRRGNEAEVRAASDMVLENLRRDLGEMVGREVEFGSQGALKKLLKKVDKASRKIAGTADDAVPQRAFMQLDELKRDIGKITRKARGKIDRGGLSEDLATFHRLERTYEGLRGHLELETLWGKAGTLQKRINAPWTENIATNSEFNRLFSNPVQGKWGARSNEASRDKVAAFVKAMTNPNKSDSMRALTAQLDTLEEFSRVAGEVMHLPPAEAAAVKELSTQVAAMRGKLDEAAEAIAARNQMKALDQAGRDSSGVATTVGALLGGAPGAFAGRALEVVTNPAKTIRQLAAMHSLMAKLETRQVKALARIASSSVPKIAHSGGRLATRALISPETGQRFEEIRAQTEQAKHNPEAMREQVYAGLGDLPLGAPDTAARAADQALAASMYLGRQLPEGATPSPPEMKRWLEIADALGDPTSVLEDAGRGKVRTHQIRAIADVYPEIFSQMRMDVADQLAELEADGRQLPYAQRTSLGVAFGLDTDPMLRHLPAMQAGYAPAPPEPVPPPPPAASSGPAPQLADSLMTGPERRASEG